MPNRIEAVKDYANMQRLIIEQLDGGMSTRALPQTQGGNIAPNLLDLAQNAVFWRDGMVAKRPGNQTIGATGSGAQWDAMASAFNGTEVVVKSGQAIYAASTAVITSGAWNKISGATLFGGSAAPMTFAQMYDPDFNGGGANAAAILIMCDGSQVPYGWDGVNFKPFATANLPLNRAGTAAITPSLVLEWGPHLVLSGESTEPTGIYISDALRPERYSSVFVDSAQLAYTPYFPGGRDGSYGKIQALATINDRLIIFFESAIVVGVNTGSYGAMNYQFRFLSRSIGTTSGRSVVNMDAYVMFYSGNRFYCTDGYSLMTVTDELPTYYSYDDDLYQVPLFIPNSVIGARYGQQYWASIPTVPGILVFDIGANGGFVPGDLISSRGSGGAWAIYTGMDLNCACYIPVDPTLKIPDFFWGRTIDQGGQFNSNGGFGDFGQPIAFEVRARAFYMGAPNTPATVQNITAKLQQPTNGTANPPGPAPYTVTPTLYALVDQTEYDCPQSSQQVPYRGGQGPLQPCTIVADAPSGAQGYMVQLGIRESSTLPVAISELIAEVTVDEPRAAL